MKFKHVKYFPDLEKCFNGEAFLLSWEEVLKYLLSNHSTTPSSSIKSFFKDPQVEKTLSQDIPIFLLPSDQSRTLFNTKTAAINVTPSKGSTFNIEEIKNDALWLSASGNLDEMEALRITVIEWQNRSKYRLREEYSEAELSSLHFALGSGYVERYNLILGGSNNRPETNFDSGAARRLRLISLYLQEQVHLVSTKREILSLQIMKEIDPDIARHEVVLWENWIPITSSMEQLLEVSINQIQDHLQNLGQTQQDANDSSQINWNSERITSSLEMIASINEILLLQTRSSNIIIDSRPLLSWLHLMTKVDYFTTFHSDQHNQQKLIERIQTVSSLVTLSLLDPVSTLSTIDSKFDNVDKSKSKPFVLDLDNIGEIHDLIFSIASQGNFHAGPTILSWTLILHSIRQHSIIVKEDQESQHVQWAIEAMTVQNPLNNDRSSTNNTSSQNIYEDIMDKIVSSHSIDDSIEWMLNYIVEKAQIFGLLDQICGQNKFMNPIINTYLLQILQELLAISISPLGYSSNLLSTQLSILSCQSPSHNNRSLYEPTLTFLQDDYLTKEIFDVAAARFPYESLPFLRLCRTLAKAKIFNENGIQYIHYRLENLTSFTQAATGEFSSYNTFREDENANYVTLEQPVGILKSPDNTFGMNRKEMKNILPTNTIGEVISDSYPPIIRWQYSYSGVGLLGQWLELYYMGSLDTLISPFESSEEIISEIISMITILLSTTLSEKNIQSDGVQLCMNLLIETSSQLQGDEDITYYVFEIFEQQLHSFRRRTNSESTCDLFNSCLGFIRILMKIHPEQAWSLIMKSSLFNTNQDFFNNNIGEMSILYQDFVNIALTSNISFNKIVGRTPKHMPPMAQRQNQSLLLTFSDAMVKIFVTIEDLNFDMQMIIESFNSILQFAFGIGENYGSPTDLTNIYLPAAEQISNAFLSGASEPNSIFRKLSSLLTKSFENEAFSSSLNSILKFMSLLLRHDQIIKSNSNTSSFQSRLIAVFPLLIRSLLLQDASTESLRLISTILRSIKSKSVSILGSMGQMSTIAFLDILKQIEKQSENEKSQDLTWLLLSLLIKDEQQWLSTVILTGCSPQKGNKPFEKNETVIHGEPFLNDAIQELSNISNIRPSLASNILDFSIQAQQSSFGFLNDININQNLLKILITYVCSENQEDHELSHALHNKIAGLVTQLITTYLQDPSSNKDTITIKTFIPLLNWLTSNAIQAFSYNVSLHTNLKKNFTTKYEGMKPTDIRKTVLLESEYGDQYFYDVDYASKIFSNNSYWENHKFDQQSFSAEFRRANLNLSIVDSEIFLLQSFKHLCLENCVVFSKDREIQKIMTSIISNCLIANTRIYPSEEIFEDIFQSRADLCLVLIRQLVEIQAKGLDFTDLLQPAWEATRIRNGSYEIAIANNDLEYWRSIMDILLMTLQFHVWKKPKPIQSKNQSLSMLRIDATYPIMLEICSIIVGDGFRSIVIAIHDQNQSKSSQNLVEPKDVSTVWTILQTILRLPTISQFSGQLSDCLIGSDIISSCLLLYSWASISSESSSKIQPVYAEISLQLLNSMSTVPQLAEEFAIEGVLNRILTCRITQSIQNIPGGLSHIETRSNGNFLYRLWADGLLPLCLNLLHAVGGAIAAEVSIFLNQFPKQLDYANLTFARNSSRYGETRDILTLKVATEAATLALISYILTSFRNSGASAAIDSSKISNLIGYDEQKKALEEDIREIIQENPSHRRKKILANGEKEMSLQKADGDLLDQKICQQLRQALLCLHEEIEDEKI